METQTKPWDPSTRETALNEGHGFSRAVEACALDGFSRWGTVLRSRLPEEGSVEKRTSEPKALKGSLGGARPKPVWS